LRLSGQTCPLKEKEKRIKEKKKRGKAPMQPALSCPGRGEKGKKAEKGGSRWGPEGSGKGKKKENQEKKKKAKNKRLTPRCTKKGKENSEKEQTLPAALNCSRS